MAFLAAAIPYIAAASTVVGAVGAIKQGQDQQFEAQQQAAALRNQANADAAASDRQAIQQRRQSGYLQSRVQALAAASGAGATDPTVLSIQGQIAGEGEYHALTSLYEGSTSSENLRAQSQAAINAGQSAARAGVLKGIATPLVGATSLYTKYG